jgi:hypothetical protein
MTSVRIERPDGSTDRPTHVSSKVIEKLGEMTMATVAVPRSQAASLSLVEDEDEVYLEDSAGNDVFGGVLRNSEPGESTAELTVDGWEVLAADAQRTPPGQRRENTTDDAVVTEAIDASPRLSVGTTEQTEAGLTFVFDSVSQARKARQVERAAAGELRYNPDLTVDYLSRVGADKTGSITVSPSSGNTDGQVITKKNTRARRATHLTLVGAGEGTHKRYVNAVPESDPDTYDNEVRYDAGTAWEPGDRNKWDTLYNKTEVDESSLASEARSLASEVTEREITVVASVKGEDIALGDTIRVEKPRDDIDNDLRAVVVRRIDDKDGLRLECNFSNRKKIRENSGDTTEEMVERQGQAFEGTPVTVTTGGGRQPVTPTLNYEFDFYYPAEVEYEHRVKLFVKGLAYRAYSSGAASSGGFHDHGFTIDIPDHDHDVDVTHPNHGHPIDINTTSDAGKPDVDFADSGDSIQLGATNGTTTTVDLDMPFVDGEGAYAVILVGYANQPDTTDGNQLVPNITMTNLDTNNQFYFQSLSGLFPGEYGNTIAVNTGDIENDTIEVELEQDSSDAVAMKLDASGYIVSEHDHPLNIDSTSDTALGTTNTETSVDGGGYFESTTTGTRTPEHTHPADPGVIESFPDGTYFPGDCDVLVNGSSVGLSVGDGSGPFTELVDLEGELVPGQVNTVEVTSSFLGHVQAHVDVDVYRQILGGG